MSPVRRAFWPSVRPSRGQGTDTRARGHMSELGRGLFPRHSRSQVARLAHALLDGPAALGRLTLSWRPGLWHDHTVELPTLGATSIEAADDATAKSRLAPVGERQMAVFRSLMTYAASA